jgi:MerR family transcriptional regulator, light-induced transcriptional regulator
MNNTDRSGPADRTPRHSIGVVSRRTGLTIHVLRAWERRYGVVRPGRTQGRQRLYAEADIAHLRLLKRATENGHAIGRVARLSTPELLTLIGADCADGEGKDGGGSEAAEEDEEAAGIVARGLEAAAGLDEATLRAELKRAALRFRPSEFVERVAGPLLVEAGERWHAGAWTPAHEHTVSAAVRRTLQWLLDAMEVSGEAPTLVATTLSGEQHELGAMLAGVVAAEEGWRVVYPGPDLPAVDIASIARVRAADVVAVSQVHDEGQEAAVRAVRSLRAALPASTALLAGGRAVVGVMAQALREAGAAPVGRLGALRQVLRAIEEQRPRANAAA